MDQFWAVATPILTAVLTGMLLKIGDWYLNRGRDKREYRKDLREEIAELWERLDKLEAENTSLRGKVTELDFFKQRYAAADLENQALKHQVSDMQKQIDEQKRHIEGLEREIAQLKARRR